MCVSWEKRRLALLKDLHHTTDPQTVPGRCDSEPSVQGLKKKKKCHAFQRMIRPTEWSEIHFIKTIICRHPPHTTNDIAAAQPFIVGERSIMTKTLILCLCPNASLRLSLSFYDVIYFSEHLKENGTACDSKFMCVRWKCQALSSPLASLVHTEQYYGRGAVAASPSDGP